MTLSGEFEPCNDSMYLADKALRKETPKEMAGAVGRMKLPEPGTLKRMHCYQHGESGKRMLLKPLRACKVSLVSLETVMFSTLWIVPLYSEPYALSSIHVSGIAYRSQMSGEA